MKIGILGGSFDPLHNGHIRLARAALRQLTLDRVYFVPAARSPFKRERRPTSASQRVRLLRAALKGEPRCRVATWELRRSGPSYTIDTLRRYHRDHPRDDLFFLTGSDALAGFPRWKNASAILDLCTLAAARRPGTRRLRRPFGRPVVLLKGRFPDISSSALRKDLAAGRPVAGRMPAAAAALAKTWYKNAGL